jgi:hypothetical protein
MSGLVTCLNTPSKEMSIGEGQRNEIFTQHRLEVSMSAHLWGSDMRYRFKQRKRKNLGWGKRYA